MFPPFPEDEALELCKTIVRDLDSKKIFIKQMTAPSEERNGDGKQELMIGVAVCTSRNSDSCGENKKIYLAAASGNSREIVFPPPFITVPSIVSGSRIYEALLKNDKEIHELTDRINEHKKLLNNNRNSENSLELEKLCARRKLLTTESLENVHSLYSFHTFDGRKKTLKEICASSTRGRLPPTGTGDCAEIKLADYAARENLNILSMAEILYIPESTEEKNIPPCDARCRILLPDILGLEILYRDRDIIVVNKQSGLLSVPGRGPDKQDCIVNRLKRLFPDTIEQPAVHRLDMETSGLMVLAFNKESHRTLNKEFEEGIVKKEYIALLDGILYKKGIAKEGQMELYFRLDIDNRPHQIWDEVYGKKAVTQWEILNVEDYRIPFPERNENPVKPVTRIRFIPHTGRTHQLRVASADSHGFGTAIIGDTLYGKCGKGERLMLHARYLNFIHPSTGNSMEFFCEPPF